MNDSVRFDGELQAVGTYDYQAGEEALDFVDNFRTFATAVNGFLRGLNFTVEYRHAEVAEKALQTYQIAKVFGRRPNSTAGTYVARMREALNRAGKKRGRKVKAE